MPQVDNNSVLRDKNTKPSFVSKLKQVYDLHINLPKENKENFKQNFRDRLINPSPRAMNAINGA